MQGQVRRIIHDGVPVDTYVAGNADVNSIISHTQDFEKNKRWAFTIFSFKEESEHIY